MFIELREMTIEDYPQVYALWKGNESIGLSDADSKENIKRFLDRNPDLSLVALDNETLVGAALCGHDGRRGYIHHLFVKESHRRQGIGRSLVGKCIYGFMRIGIAKCHLFVFGDDKDAVAFWQNIGWTKRVELINMSQYVSSNN